MTIGTNHTSNTTTDMGHPAWEALRKLKPALPQHTSVQRRDYHGERWYVLEDKLSGRFHRFSPRAYQVLSHMDGHRSLEALYQLARQLPPLQDEAPIDQTELVELMQYLHVADLLQSDLPPATAELFQRRQQQRQQRWAGLMLNPTIWRFPLGNPDRLLEWLMPLARMVSHPIMGLLWLMVVGVALVQTFLHWPTISGQAFDQLLSAQNLAILWLTYPALKVIHELGHGLFTKVWGGHIQECGVVVAMGIPLPYVDATAATAFASKRQRLMVGAAGMAVELFIAAIALLLWLQVENGVLKAVLFNLMLLGSVSTLFFNGNPLLRFDGYHLLCDMLDSPNLASRASQHLNSWVKGVIYRIDGVSSPARSKREGRWLMTYAIAAFLYRLGIFVAIVMIAAHYLPTLGVLLALWLIVFQLMRPIGKQLWFLYQDPSLNHKRRRAFTLTGVSALFLALIIGLLPMPYHTQAEGVVWLPDDARLRAQAPGLVLQQHVQQGEYVEVGQTLLTLQNDELKTQLAIANARLKEAEIAYQQAWQDNYSQALMLEEERKTVAAKVASLNEKINSLTLTSASAGNVYWHSTELTGRYIKQGAQLGFIDQPGPITVRAAFTQPEISLIQSDRREVNVRLSQQLSHIFAARLPTTAPIATTELPSPALGAAAGGRLSITPNESDTTSTEVIFLLDIELITPASAESSTIPALSSSIPSIHYGQKAFVRIRHSAMPLGQQWYRYLYRQFLTFWA